MRPIRSTILLAFALVAAAPVAAQERPSAAAVDSLLVRASESRIKGAMDAPVTIIELSDFQCPFCREFTRTAYPALDSAYIRTGKARLVYLNLHLPTHPRALGAAEAALCAGAQGKFWPMHDRLFAAQEEWSAAPDAGGRFAAYARDLDLDAEAFRTCTGDDLMAPLILGDVIQAAGSGEGATPTFIINGKRVRSGARPFAEFQQAIEEALAGGSSGA